MENSNSNSNSNSNNRNSSSQLLEELEALSESLYKSDIMNKPDRRTSSFTLPRSSQPEIDENKEKAKIINSSSRTTGRSRRLSLSSFRLTAKSNDQIQNHQTEQQKVEEKVSVETEVEEKKPKWRSWKPIRALSHIGKQKLTCLFSVEVVTVQNLPSSMNGLRLSVCVRKKETRDGSVHTMPCRVSEKTADFEETLFVKCHVYFTQNKQIKFEPRPFLIYVSAADAEQLNFGRLSVDLSRLVQESIDKSFEGARVRQWETSLRLSGKAKGGELVVKLGFQIMEKDGGVDVYNQSESSKSVKDRTFSFGRRQSKNSFSVLSPKMFSSGDHSRRVALSDLHGIDELKLEDGEVPEFEVEEKGVEIEENRGDAEEEVESEERSVTSEVVKEIVNDQIHKTMMIELDSIAQQIKALEHLMTDSKIEEEEEIKSQRLDADEENVTRDFFQLLEDEETDQHGISNDLVESESEVYVPDLGKNLGSVIQTKDGGFLIAMNPLDTLLPRNETPKLAMQVSKPFVIPLNGFSRGFELFQELAAEGFEKLSSQIFSLMSLDELTGKTAEQIAFEGIAKAIIQGRNREGPSSTAARTISSVKTMARGMTTGRKDRISSGIWNINDSPLSLEDILAFSLQKIETMAVECLKIQAEIAEQDSPFNVSPLDSNTIPLANAVPLEDWVKKPEANSISISLLVQLRDPIRRYEAVGGPALVLIQARPAEEVYNDDLRYKVTSLHIGGLKLRSGDKRNEWDSEKQKLTAMQWLLVNGLGKTSRRGKRVFIKGPDLFWSLSSRVAADMWLKHMRNPDIKFTK